ncbi:MAG: HpcH/HpaI aldolase family protein [Hylemonella sp.]
MTASPYPNLARQKMARRELVLCLGLRQARTPDIGSIAAASGFDAIYVDMEHSPISHDQTATLCVAALGQGVTPLVRVPGHTPHDISRVLDGGAQGVIVPHVNNVAEAQAVVRAAKFPPAGHRSVMGANPALGYRSFPLKDNNQLLNQDTLVIVMLETPEGIANADAIAAVAGVDMLLIGTNDLCTEMGIPGQIRHPEIVKAYEQVAQACMQHNKWLGIGGIRGDAELQARILAMGACFIIAGNDVSYLMSAAKADAQTLRQISSP